MSFLRSITFPDSLLNGAYGRNFTSRVNYIKWWLMLSKHMVQLDYNGLCIWLVLGCSHFNIGAFMEKGLSMAAGQTPVQKYWYVSRVCCS